MYTNTYACICILFKVIKNMINFIIILLQHVKLDITQTCKHMNVIFKEVFKNLW